MLAEHLKTRLKKPDQSRSQSRPRGGKGTGKKGKNAAPIEDAQNAAPVQKPEARFKGLLQKCRDRRIMICTAFLGAPQQCKRGQNCDFLHYNHSLVDKAINAYDKGEALPMDLHDPPMNKAR